MSLDENALNSYREQHKLNQTQHQQKREQTLAIPQSSLVTSSTKITLNSDNNSNNNLLSASNTIPASQRGAKLTIAPHPNFISLRSGSDSVHSSWIKSQGRSCDYSDDVMSSLSLQQPPTLNPNRSSSPLNNAPPPAQSRNINFIPLTSQRPINPMSSLRRHMFVNSRRHAQTTGDELRAYDDSMTNNELSYEMVNSVSLASTNQLASLFLNSANANETDNNNNSTQPASKETPSVDDESKQAPAKEYADPNLLNPSWIPLIVRRTLLEMHEQAVLSKSDSNIKSKYRSSNHLLHSPASKVNKDNKMLKSNRKKKPLSLQNSQDKSTFVSVSPNANNNSRVSATGVSNNSFSNFYDELRSKIFHSSSPSNKSTSPSNPNNSTISTGSSKQEPKRKSIDQQNSLNSISGLSGSNNFSTRSSLSNTTVILNPNSNSETINLISLSPKSIGKPV